MKIKLFTSALLIAVSLCGFAQDKATLDKDMQKFIDINDKQDYKSLVDIIYPKVFDKTSREQFISDLEKSMNGKGYTIYPERIEPQIDYGAVQGGADGYFCIITYNVSNKVALENKVQQKEQAEVIKKFGKIFNSKNVYYDEPSNTIHSKNRTQVVAIADGSTNGQWTFVNPAAAYAKGILHEDIRNALDPESIPEETADNTNKKATTKKSDNSVKSETQTAVEKAAAEKAALEKKLNGGK